MLQILLIITIILLFLNLCTDTKILLYKIYYKQKKTMATIQELNDKVDSLQVKLDEKQTAIANALIALRQQIQDLQDIINAGSGATPEQLDAVMTKLDAITEDLGATPTE